VIAKISTKRRIKYSAYLIAENLCRRSTQCRSDWVINHWVKCDLRVTPWPLSNLWVNLRFWLKVLQHYNTVLIKAFVLTFVFKFRNEITKICTDQSCMICISMSCRNIQLIWGLPISVSMQSPLVTTVTCIYNCDKVVIQANKRLARSYLNRF